MLKKNKIIILIIPIILILVGIVLLIVFGPQNSSSSSNENKIYEVETVYDYEYVESLANSLYKTDDTIIEIKEEKDEYTIIVKDSKTGKTKNEFVLNRETGAINEKVVNSDNAVVTTGEG